MKPGQLVAVAVGGLLMVVPGLWGYRGSPAGDVHHTVGPLLIAFGVIAFWTATRDLRWLNLPLAAALLAAPLLTRHSGAAAALAIGAACTVIASTPFGGPDQERRGEGWRGVMEGANRVVR